MVDSTKKAHRQAQDPRGQKKRHGLDRAMPIRQSGTWVGGEMSLIF